MEIPLSSSTPLDIVSQQFGAFLHGIKAEASSLPTSISVKPTINLGKKEKNCILDKYQMQYGLDYSNLIVIKRKVRTLMIFLLSVGLG